MERLFFVSLTHDDLVALEEFDCGDDEMNQFIRRDCYEEQELGLNATYLLYSGGELAAFCSICADRIILGKSEKEDAELPRGMVPAIKIARLGRATKFKQKQVGIKILKLVHRKIIEIAPQIGARFLTLDAYPKREAYYGSLGFVRNLNQGKNNPTVSMRKDIFELFD